MRSRFMIVAFSNVCFCACTSAADGATEAVEGRPAYLRATTHDAGVVEDLATSAPAKTSLVPSNVPIHLQPFD